MKNRIEHTFVILAYKESPYLEECIKSVVNQSIKTNAVIATSTPNDFIKKLAKKYQLELKTLEKNKGIAEDFNHAYECVNTSLVTIAHQDDIYESDYAKKIMENREKYSNSTIIFTNYYEIRNNSKINNSTNQKIKRILLLPLKFKLISNFKIIKRSALRLGNAICCPTVTFCKDNITIDKIFTSNFISNMDWLAWERLSKIKGRFIYINKVLVGHRIHEDAATSKIISDGKRTNEDYEMFLKFWPKSIAKFINNFYKNNEKDYQEK